MLLKTKGGPCLVAAGGYVPDMPEMPGDGTLPQGFILPGSSRDRRGTGVLFAGSGARALPEGSLAFR